MHLFTSSSLGKRDQNPCVKAWRQHVKMYKKTGIRLREAILLGSEGQTMSRDGEPILTDQDIMYVRKILLHKAQCDAVLRMESLTYCVKVMADNKIVLFNGCYYVIGCQTEQHTLLVNIKAGKLDSDRTLFWMQRVSEKLEEKVKQ